MAAIRQGHRRGRHRTRLLARWAIPAFALLLLVPPVASATTLPSTISEDTTLTKAASPYIGSSTIQAGATVVVEPGVTFRLGGGLYVHGTLKAEGTAEDPIVFTGAKEEAPGEWCRILFYPDSGASVIDNAELKYGGGCNGGTIASEGASPRITNSTIRNSSSQGIYIREGGYPEVASNQFIANTGAAVEHRESKYATYVGEVNIHDNFVEGGGSGIIVDLGGATQILGKNLGGNTVIGSGTALSYQGPDIPGNITENVLAGNSINTIRVGGTVAHSSTWSDAGTRVRFEGSVQVSAGVTLSIAEGLNLLNPNLYVHGTLKAEGTAEDPIVFTGAKEEAPGEWSGIRLQAGSGASVLDHVEVGFGSSGMIEVTKSSPTITRSTFFRSSGYAMRVTESGSPAIEWNRFRGNTNGLSYSGTGKLLAPNNDWGCASGPKPAGCGDSVTSNVEWKPAAQLQEQDGHCRGNESQCPEGADPVSLATGDLTYSHRDLLLTNKSDTPLEFNRYYNSGQVADTGLGPGWSQTGLASATELATGAVLVVGSDGRQDLFYPTESGFKAPSGVTSTLAKVEGTFQLTTLRRTVYRFDASGRIASITDDHGLKTTYGYNSSGRLSTITDPSAQTLAFSYNASNHITSVKDSTGREVKYTYSLAGELATVTDPLGGITEYTYDVAHRIKTFKDPRGNIILKNTYDGQGRVVEQRDGLENFWKLEYKEGETVVTEPEGGKLVYGFDGQDRVVFEKDQLGNVTTTSYDAAGNIDEIVQPGTAKWQFGHDTAGNLTSVEDPEGGERKYEYNAQNRPISFTDARGNSWSYEWSGAGDLLKTVDPEGGETVLTYNESGQPLTSTDPNKHKTEFTWDTRGNQLSATDPLGHKTNFEYNSRSYLIGKTLPGLKAETFERDALGDLLAHTTPEGHKTKYAYDKNGLLIQLTDPGENVWKIERNAMERPTLYTDPLEQQAKVAYNGDLKPVEVINRRGKETTYTYDLANRLTEAAFPEGGDWKFGYDARGNRASVVEPRGRETTYEHDLLNRMIKANEPLGVTSEYGYDANGDLTSVKDPRGNTTSYAYDKLGHLTEVAQPLEKATTYSYDLAGNRLTQTTAAGTLEYGYDAANRLTKVSAGESTLRSLGYDAANRLTSATDSEGHKIEIGRNEEGLVSSINDGRGQSLTRSYDSRGLLTKQVDGRGTLEYGYDKLGRLTFLTDPQGKALGFAYNPEGDLAEVTRPSGVTTTNIFNEAGRLAETNTVETGEPPTTLESLNYGYDAAGNVISKVDQRLEQETTYAYDALGRLTEFDPPGESATSYGYDKAGNRTEAGGTTATYNALNQLTESSEGTSYSYDGAGRLTETVNGPEEATYTWNLLDHLARVEGPSETTSYGYDGLERLSERKGEGGTTVFHYGDLTDLPTYLANGEGEVTASYVQGAHGLIERRSGGATSYPLADSHGDITAISGPGGEVESRQSYGPWGEQLSGPGLEMGYLGAWERPTDPVSALIQMGARSYDASLGRFLTEDPVMGHLGIGASTDRYLYVWDNPLNYYDLNGRETCVSVPLAGDVCPVKGIEDATSGAETAWHGVEEAGNGIGSSAENAWNWTAPVRSGVASGAEHARNFTAPARSLAANVAQDFWKEFGSPLKSAYNFAGENWKTCVEGAPAGAAVGFYVGTAVFPVIGSGAGAAGGGLVGCGGLVAAQVGASALTE